MIKVRHLTNVFDELKRARCLSEHSIDDYLGLF